MSSTDNTQQALPLPSAPPIQLSSSTLIQPPLSRFGKGPALILLIDEELSSSSPPKRLDPLPIQKWAEEGYAVGQVDLTKISEGAFATTLLETIKVLRELPQFDGNERIGIITYLSSISPEITEAVNSNNAISAIVSYGSAHAESTKPHVSHKCGEKGIPIEKDAVKRNKTYYYPKVEPFFVLPSHKSYNASSASVSHTRTLTFLKPILGGPFFDLEEIWEEHCLYEFGERAVEKTMSTMVQEPYVNHIPTITGGIGRSKLTAFYRDHFVFNNPEDTALELVSRTVGIDRVIDEFVFSFTHDKIIDWLIPGIPPTGKHVRVPFTSVVNVRGDRLYHEHIAWDQASVLRQLVLLPEYLPFPYPVDGKEAAPGKRFEYRVPAAGVETAMKLVDEASVESNTMLDFTVREVDHGTTNK